MCKDGNCWRQIDAALTVAKKSDKPTADRVPYRRSASARPKQGKAAAHGEPLGAENLAETKKNLGLALRRRLRRAAGSVRPHGRDSDGRRRLPRRSWDELMAEYTKAYPEL